MARRWLHDATHDAEQRRLPRAVGAVQEHVLMAADPEAEVGHQALAVGRVKVHARELHNVIRGRGPLARRTVVGLRRCNHLTHGIHARGQGTGDSCSSYTRKTHNK